MKRKIGVAKYHLLPFRFRRLNNDLELLVNEAGDYLFVETGSVEKIVLHQVELNTKLYFDCLANHIISIDKIPSLTPIIATRIRTKKAFLEGFTSLHIFVMTLRCNHNCIYCQVSHVTESDNTSKYDISYSNLDSAITFMLLSSNKHLTMEFQGGEPLLVYPKVKYAIMRAKASCDHINKSITFVVCTNLTCLTDEMLVFFAEYNVLISTSLDGPEFIHNANRRLRNNSSYSSTIYNIQRCREALGIDKVSALMTASHFSIKYPNEIVDEYINLGFESIFLRPISPYGVAKQNKLMNCFTIEDFVCFYINALERIIDYNLNGTFLMESYAKIILTKILSPFSEGFVDLMSPAGLINNVLVFNFNGLIYPSDEARMIAQMGDNSLCLGKLGSDSYNEVIMGSTAEMITHNWSLEGLAGCADCAYIHYCGADPVRYYATQKDLYGFRPGSDHCIKNTLIIDHLFTCLNSKRDYEKVFYNWVYAGKD